MLILYTPLPNANTGTAAYASALLDDLAVRAGPPIKKQTIVAVDCAASEEQGGAERSQGWQVQDFRSVVRRENDLCVYFLASNQYHYFCYEQLATHSRGRSLGLIHDLSAGYMLRNMSTHLGSPYLGCLPKVFEHDFGARALALHYHYDLIHEISRHFISAQGLTLEKCDGLLVHSYYAKAKLLLDTGLGDSLARRIRVCAHPVPRTVPEPRGYTNGTGGPGGAGQRKYRVGSLGYYLRMKRFPSIISAWSRFLDRNGVEDSCELLLGGDVPSREKRKMLRLCEERFRPTINFAGFLDEDEMHRTIQSLDLVMALRFPSNGETSGMVAHCLAYQTPIAISEFAAFREEPAAFRISVSPEHEIEELTVALEEGFEAWKKGTRLPNRPAEWAGAKQNLALCLLNALG